MPLTAHIIYALLILAVPRIIAAAAPLSDDPPTISHSSSLTQTADPTGKELFNHIDIPNHNSLLPRDHKQEKRVIRQYPARLCPPGWETVNSWCDYAHGPQAYQLTCKHSLIENVNVEEGRCNNDEMCFDYIKYDQDQVTLRRAYCVSEWDFYQLSLPDTGLASSQRGTAYFSASTLRMPSWDAHKTLEVILVDSQERNTLNAASLRIQAQRLSNVNGHPSAQTLPGGLNECTDCSSIGLDSVPDGTEGFTLDIIMKTKVNEGKLLIGSIIT